MPAVTYLYFLKICVDVGKTRLGHTIPALRMGVGGELQIAQGIVSGNIGICAAEGST